MARSLQHRRASGRDERLEPRDIQELEYDSDERAVWAAKSNGSDEKHPDNSEAEVLTMRIFDLIAKVTGDNSRGEIPSLREGVARSAG